MNVKNFVTYSWMCCLISITIANGASVQRSKEGLEIDAAVRECFKIGDHVAKAKECFAKKGWRYFENKTAPQLRASIRILNKKNVFMSGVVVEVSIDGNDMIVKIEIRESYPPL